MRILILAAVLALTAANGAATEFQSTFGGPEVDRGIFAVPTHDGGYVAVGSTASEGAGGEDVYLVKIDASGREEWTRTYGGEGDENGWTVLAVPDGYVIGGFTTSWSVGENDFLLLKTDLAGEMEWFRTYGGPGNDRCWSLIQPDDGGYLLAGETTSVGEGQRDCWLVRTDAKGNEIWTRSYGGSKGDRAFSVVEAEAGFVVAGQTFSQGAGDRDAYVFMTNESGDLAWSRTFGGAESDVAHCVTATRDGSFLVTGYTTSFAEEGDDPFLVLVDAGGEELWTRVLPLDGVNHTLTGDEAADGGFYLVGFSAFPGVGPTAALVVRSDAEGQMAWHRNIQASDVGESFGYTVKATADGGCLFAGHASVGSPGNLDLLVVRLNGEGP